MRVLPARSRCVHRPHPVAIYSPTQITKVCSHVAAAGGRVAEQCNTPSTPAYHSSHTAPARLLCLLTSPPRAERACSVERGRESSKNRPFVDS